MPNPNFAKEDMSSVHYYRVHAKILDDKAGTIEETHWKML